MITILIMVAMSMVVWTGSAYFFTMLFLGVRHLRRQKVSLGYQASLGYGRPHLGRKDDFFVYFLVPCLNEERVIGNTVRGLTGHEAAHVVVVDDGSDDRTGAAANEAGGGAVTVLRRDLPEARQGKGEALNAGLDLIRRMVADSGQDPEYVLVCVMDADGHLTDGSVKHVARQFDDARVGAVQLAVRIRNRDSYLARVQDFYFWAIAAMTQFGRVGLGTVSLGGNGQFSRLTALDEMGEKPWSKCLTEDLDLTISLVLAGWRTSSTPHAAVSQQAVHMIEPLIRQRTRWYQGHMSCGRRLPQIWNSRKLTHGQATELCMYLLVPWILDLPWSVLWQIALLNFVGNVPAYFVTDSGPLSLVASILFWYVLSFGPALVAGVLQKRRSPDTSWLRSMLLGHSFVVMNYLFFLCVWKALFALRAGKTTWEKTARVHEDAAVPAPPHARPALDEIAAPVPVAQFRTDEERDGSLQGVE